MRGKATLRGLAIRVAIIGSCWAVGPLLLLRRSWVVLRLPRRIVRLLMVIVLSRAQQSWHHRQQTAHMQKCSGAYGGGYKGLDNSWALGNCGVNNWHRTGLAQAPNNEHSRSDASQATRHDKV